MLEQKPTAPTKFPPPGWFGPIYYNPEDPRVFLPKLWGFGYTCNFARPTTRVIFLALFVAPLIIQVAVLLFAR